MPFIAHPFDVFAWYRYCSSVLDNGFGFSALSDWLNPFWPLTLTVVAYLYGGLSAVTGLKAVQVSGLPAVMNPQYGIQYVPGPLFNVVVKIPMLLSDLAIAFLLTSLF